MFFFFFFIKEMFQRSISSLACEDIMRSPSPEEGPHLPGWHSDLFPASVTRIKTFLLLYELPSLWYFIIAVRMD